MAKIIIEGKTYEVEDGQNLLHACLSLGFDIPYFCWHPAMHSVGACRQCAVKMFKDDKDTKGRIVMSCMTPATEGARISIDDPEAKAFRADVIEWLMINHPHDCPVCDEGGECHLQDMTVMTGHVRRRYRFKKRTYRNQYLGPLLNHEMNRCIQCYRCVRFYRGYAAGRDLDVFGAHDNIYFGRCEDGILENEFSGNLVEVCPTGVFTDKTLKAHYTRKWDLQSAPSVCVHCGVGCNTIAGERYGGLRRILNRYNAEVNGYFLCDRGRYGYEFVNSEKRLANPLIRTIKGGSISERVVTVEEALCHSVSLLRKKGGLIGIGSPRGSLEANYALQRLVGKENFYNGMSEVDSRLVALAIDLLGGPARSPSLKEMGTSDAVLILGEDVTNTAPVLALTLRQAARQRSFKEAGRLRIPLWDDSAVRTATQSIKGNLYVATPYATKLEDVAEFVCHVAPDDIARFGFAVAHEIDIESPAVDRLSDDVKKTARLVADALKAAERPLVVSGVGCGSDAVIQAASSVARALLKAGKKSMLSYVVPECNSMGVGLMNRRSVKDAFSAAEHEVDTLIVLENDLYRRADKETVDRFLKRFRNIIILDSIASMTCEKATAIFPCATFAESEGTLVNNEGRAQRFYQVFVPKDDIGQSWRLIKDMMTEAGFERPAWNIIDDVATGLAKEVPALKGIIEAAPSAGFRVIGMKIARQTHRYSGRTAMHADKTVFEPRPPDDLDSPLSFSMEGFQGQPPSPLIPRLRSPLWNSAQAVNKFQSKIGGPLQGGDPGKRLIEPAEKREALPMIPHPFTQRRGEWLLIPRYHIFGSEETSMLAPAIAALAADPYIALNLQDSERLNVAAGEEVSVKIKGIVLKLVLKYVEGLPAGVAALPSGLPGFSTVQLPAWGVLSKVKVSAA